MLSQANLVFPSCSLCEPMEGRTASLAVPLISGFTKRRLLTIMRIVFIMKYMMSYTAPQDADIVARKMEGSMAQTLGPRHEPSASPVLCPQRKRITTADLMQGAREIIVLHQGEEYLLRITKRGKLILTK